MKCVTEHLLLVKMRLERGSLVEVYKKMGPVLDAGNVRERWQLSE